MDTDRAGRVYHRVNLETPLTASSDGNCRHVESLIPVMISFLRPVRSIASRNAGQRRALMTPVQRMIGTSGNIRLRSGRIGVFGP